MIVEYICRSCGLCFALGTCDGVVGDKLCVPGFCVYLVCTSCGTQHACETADSFADEQHGRPPAMKDRLLGSSVPTFSAETGEDNELRELPVQGERQGTKKAFSLEEQICGHCGTMGRLTVSLSPDVRLCPHCKNQTLQEDFRFVT